MIARLRGVIADKGIDHIIVDVQGVGYEATVSLRTLQALPGVGEEATVHVHTHVREDAIQLFGFHDGADKTMFTRLTSVSGIGPKLAVNAFSIMSAAELQSAIVAGDVKALSRISGVGKKTAQRIVLELAERVKGLDVGGLAFGAGAGTRAPQSLLGDLRAALGDLGYAPKQADAVVERLEAPAAEGASLEELLREALAMLRS